ncbi:MAG: sigma-70 family RNA polymerase sigma factor [Bacteroidota bacterium]
MDHLFRQESGKMVAVLTKLFGFDQLEIAEDIVQDTFIQAHDTWKLKGIPDKPVSWLYTVAKNKATDLLRRQQTKRKVDAHLRTAIPVEYSITAHLEQAFYEIKDNQLRMLFAVCHPAIPEEAQIALALKTLGGFNIQEIARAFLTTKEVINKRLFRAKDKIRREQIALEVPEGEALQTRVERVLKTIYLLYNEGYHSASAEVVMRKDLCLEAIRLALLLHESQLQQDSDVCALLALMCFHTSRFESRMNELGQLIPLGKQDRTKWNVDLIARGTYFMQSMNFERLSTAYELEAAIAYLHTLPDGEEKWSAMLALHDRLLMVKNNTNIHLNMALVISKVRGPEEALRYLQRLEGVESNYLFYALRGDISRDLWPTQAREDLQKAIALAPLEAERAILLTKLQAIRPQT